MKHKKKKVIIAVIITLVVATAAFLFFACQSHESGYTPPPENVHTVTAPPPTDGSTPEDYDGLDNLAFMAGRLAAREFYHTENNGLVDTIANQTVVGSKDYYKGLMITQSISTSAFVNVAEQKFFGDGKVVVRGPEGGKSSWDGINTKWSDDEPIAVYDEQQYEDTYGLWATEFSDYVMNAETILEVSELNVLGDGLYSQTFTLDPGTSTYYYKHQMMTMGGLGDYPLFSSVVITFTFDDTWAVQRVDIAEEYEVYAFFMTVGCKATSSIVYSYDESAVDVSAYESYFSKYADASVTGGGDKELGVTDYLQLGFAEYLAEPSSFALSLDIGGSKADGIVTLDITNGINVRADIDGIYVNVTDENVFLSYKDMCGYVPLSFMTEKLGLGGVLDLDGILAVLGEGTIIKDGENVTINCALSLGGPEIPLVFSFTETDGDVVLNGVSVELKTDIIDISASLVPTEGDVAEKDVTSAEDMSPLLDNIIRTVSEKSFAISLDYVKDGLSVTGEAYLNAQTLGAEGEFTVVYDGISIPVDFVFDGESVYLKVFNVGVKASVDEISAAVQTLLGYLGMSSIESAVDIGGIISSLVENYDVLIRSLTFTSDGLGLVLDGDLLLSCLDADLGSIGDVTAGYDVDGNVFALEAFGARVTLGASPVRVVTAPDTAAEYVEFSVLESFVGPIKAIADSRDVAFSMEIVVTANGKTISGELVGEIKFISGIEVYLKITVSGKAVEIYYADGVAYFGIAGHNFRVSESELKMFAERLSSLAEELGLSEDMAALLSSDGLDLTALLESIRLSGALEDGKGILGIFADMSVLNAELSDIALTFGSDGEKLFASLDRPFTFGGLSLDSAAVTVYAANGEYSYDTADAISIMPYLDGICDLLENRSAEIDVSYYDASVGLSINGSVYADLKTMSVGGELTVIYGELSVPIVFTYVDGTVYLKAYNVGVKTDIDYLKYALEQLLAYTGTELPEVGVADISGIVTSILEADLDLIVTNFEVTETFAVMTVDGNALLDVLGADLGNIDIKYEPGTNIFTIDVLGAHITLAAVPARTVTAPDNAAEYAELSALESFVGPIKAIADSRDAVFSLAFDAVLLGLNVSVDLEGEAIFADSLTSLYIKAYVYSEGYADETLELLYADGYITVIYGGKAMKIEEAHISRIADAIGGISGGSDGSVALALFGSDGIDLNKLLQSVEFAAREEEGRTIADIFADLGFIDDALPALNAQLICDGEVISVAVGSTELYGLSVSGLTASVKAGDKDMTCDLTGVEYCGNIVDFVLGAYVELTDSPYMQVSVNYVSDLIEADVSGLFEFKATETSALDIDFDIQAEIHTYAYDDNGAKVSDGSHYLDMTVKGENAYLTYSLYGYNADGAISVFIPVKQLFEIGNMVLPLLGIDETAYYFDMVNNLLSTDYTYFSTGIFDAMQFADILGLLDGITVDGESGSSTSAVTVGKNESGEKTLAVNGIDVGTGVIDLDITSKLSGEIAYDTSKSYIDISSISYLLGDLLKAYDYIDTGYALSGTVKMKVLGIELDLTVGIDLRVGVDESGMPYLNVRLSTNGYANAFGNLIPGWNDVVIVNGDTETDITYKDGNIYMTRTQKTAYDGWDFWGAKYKFKTLSPYLYEYRRMTLSEFGADAMNQMFFALNIADKFSGYISSQVDNSEPANNGSDAGDMVNGYSFDGSVYNLKLNLGAIADNDALGELDLNITRQKLNGRDYYDLVRLNGSITLVSVVTATFDITHDSVGAPVDLSVIDENISRVNANI